jgi:hypothetical protein
VSGAVTGPAIIYGAWNKATNGLETTVAAAYQSCTPMGVEVSSPGLGFNRGGTRE